MGKIVISKVWDRELLFLMDEQNHPQLIKVLTEKEDESLVGNIYVGRVSEVLSGIQGAFVNIGGRKVFLPLKECPGKEPASLPRQGEEFPVQIIAPALKTKCPTASGKLSLTGRYCVCRMEEHGIYFSKKLSPKKCGELKSAVLEADLPERKKYGFTIRTNAGALDDLEPLFLEMRKFMETFEKIRQNGKHRTAYSCLYRTENECVRAVKNIPMEKYSEIVTDLVPIYEQLQDSVADKGLRLYQDERLLLAKLYSLETHLKQALARQVWLPCGGYLIIEPTEAMTVIDVNSGKGSNGKGAAAGKLSLKVNKEAAAEIARQLRLRNLSGMIMVDFINLTSKAEERELLDCLDGCLKEDPVRTRLVDMTALGIVEITRKKENRPLADSFQN